MKKGILISLLIIFLGLSSAFAQGRFLGSLDPNPYNPDSVNNPYGRYGSPYSPDSIKNPYGSYGSPYSPYSATNPYAINPPRVYDNSGNYRGNLTANPYSNRYRYNPILDRYTPLRIFSGD